MKLRTTLLVCALAGLTVFAQAPQTPPAGAPPSGTPAAAPQPSGPPASGPPASGLPATGRGGAPRAIKSPEVSADDRITFRLRAPNAREVFVTGIGARLPMTKDDQGVWTATTDPMKPDIYTYSFSVDGATFNDPNNGRFKTAMVGGGQSLVHVPGAVSWEPGSVPRGAVAHHFYKSAIIGDSRDYYVYTPPDYDPARKQPYPVLYLLHGLGDDAYGWIGTGAANVILDNLIAEGKARPMVMVNTLGYGTADMMSGGRGGALGGDQMMPNFTNALLMEVMPMVEKTYRVSKDRNDRAIAGLSMGGAEALFAGLNHLDRFAWVGSFSGAFVMWPGANVSRGTAPPAAAAPAAAPAPAAGRRGGGQRMDTAAFAKNFPGLDAKANAQLRLLWIACGTADGLNGVNRQFKEWLKTRNVQFTDVEILDVGHVWPLWRQNLTELAPMLFQPKGSSKTSTKAKSR